MSKTQECFFVKPLNTYESLKHNKAPNLRDESLLCPTLQTNGKEPNLNCVLGTFLVDASCGIYKKIK